MTDQSIGDFYANKERLARSLSEQIRQERERLEFYRKCENAEVTTTLELAVVRTNAEKARSEIARLERELERARYVGD